MEAPIETYVKEFVWSRTGESIYIDLSTQSVVLIREISAHGSSALAALWLNILQHPNNYPVQRYPYRKFYQRNGEYKVVLTVDDVTLTISMTLGSLKMKGEFVLYWFQTQFINILDAFEKPRSSPQILDDRFVKLTNTWNKMPPLRRIEIVADKNKSAEEPNEIEKTDETKEMVEEEQKDEDSKTEAVEVVNPSESRPDLAEALVQTNSQKGGDEDVDKQITCLLDGCVMHGPEFIYILWKNLLGEWFKDSNNRVYIVTPKLDVGRLKDICDLILKNKLTANLEAVYVHHKCDDVPNIGDVKRAVQNYYSSKDQVFIEYKVYSNIIYPYADFQCKFIASVNQGKVSVLQTSASFHADHFVRDSVDTVSFHQMSKDEFHQRFLKPILASQVLQSSEK